MNDIIIRSSTEEDIGGITDLFLPRKRDSEIFKWVISDGNENFRSLVAECENQIVGHIAYVSTEYAYEGKQYTGVFTIEWMVDPKFSGQAGLKLFSKVLKIGDFTFIIGGTKVVNQIYPLLKFGQPLNVLKFLKVTKPLKYFEALDNKIWKRFAKTIYYARHSIFSKHYPTNSEITLCPLKQGHKIVGESDPSTVVNSCKEDHLDWLLKAPGVNVHSFTVKRSKIPIGTAICYTQSVQNVTSGRIVYLSLLPKENAIWDRVVQSLEEFLMNQGCCVITTLASYPPFIDVLKTRGHVITHELPFWLKDRKKLFLDASWHLTYLEGDLDYRGLHLTDFVQEEAGRNAE
ncbi:MAG: hypothetical protein K0U54_03410 [Bacteroidetes bacterium]|nr:hypothetical protein [Bacteroidota bacterium]